MATITESINCPVCNSEVEPRVLARHGLTTQQLHTLERHIRDGQFGHVLSMIDTILRSVDPDVVGPELQTQMAIGEVHKGMSVVQSQIADMQKMFAVPKTKGDAGEIFTVKDLKSMHLTDNFAEEKARSGGTDVVATVVENQRDWGTVVVSVKYQAKWSSEFLTQARKNMDQEGTNYALLVSETFPRDALNDKGYDVSKKPEEILWLVKPEYAPFAYGCLRYALVATQKAKAVVKAQAERLQVQKEISVVIKKWINGKGFKKTESRVDSAVARSKKTTEGLEAIKSYVSRTTNSLKKEQEELRDDLGIAYESILELKKYLEGRTKKENEE